MVKALFDTNILIDYLNGIPKAKHELDRYPEKAISIITWMEIMVGATDDMAIPTRAFLNAFNVLPLDESVSERAVELRKSTKIKLPDAIVWATAQVHSLLLVTRNKKDFTGKEPGIRLPYEV